MKQELISLKERAQQDIKEASDQDSLYKIKVRYLGRKGELTDMLKKIGTLSPEERPLVGSLANEAKAVIESLLLDRLKEIEESHRAKQLREEALDISLPGLRPPLGHLHPITLVLREIKDLFISLGFQVVYGPDVETDFYNFEALNIPPDHPARDMQDTFYLPDNLLLRTHTSPVQIRTMEAHKPPLRVIAPGTVYRRDADISHSPVFHQVEGFVVDEGINFCHLKGILSLFARHIFGEEVRVRFRPSYFPFTEPSAEVDISCLICNGKGCRVCSQRGWLEILGSGMIHPQVFRAVGYDTERFSGFAFGLGVERIAMLKFGIDDIRLFFENDMRFLEQF